MVVSSENFKILSHFDHQFPVDIVLYQDIITTVPGNNSGIQSQ